MEKKIIDISTGAIIRIIAIVLGLWILYLVRDILALFFLSVILTATLDPAIDWMGKRKIARSFGVIIIYLALFLAIGVFVSLMAPPLVSQFKSFAQNLPAYN